MLGSRNEYGYLPYGILNMVDLNPDKLIWRYTAAIQHILTSGYLDSIVDARAQGKELLLILLLDWFLQLGNGRKMHLHT